MTVQTQAAVLCTRLNAYDGNDPWNDVILCYDHHDPDASEAALVAGRIDTAICEDGSSVRYEPSRHTWEVEE